MVKEPEAPVVPEKIVVCGTCDLCFRTHAGRQTCPTCGGDPLGVIIDLSSEPERAENDSPHQDVPRAVSPDGGVAPPAPAAGEAPPPETPESGDAAPEASPAHPEEP